MRTISESNLMYYRIKLNYNRNSLFLNTCNSVNPWNISPKQDGHSINNVKWLPPYTPIKKKGPNYLKKEQQ